ncbi:MAG: phosphomannomutase [halophilic archaeon J07HX5]|jgi:Phosphomannomutase|nr:MAG: phosphomannomutase [halophilic archaeon J07HX5]
MTEISFGTDGWRARTSAVTRDRVQRIGRAIVAHLSETVGADGPVAVGYDARAQGAEYATAIAGTVTATGRPAVVATRDLPTPALAWTVAEGPYAGGVMVTASHNPPAYNGVKFIPANGAPAPLSVTDDIEARLPSSDTMGADDPGAGLTDEPTDAAVDRRDLRSTYIKAVLEFVETDLSGRTIAYDAMHGSGRGVVDRALTAAGATVRQVRCSRDPTFGGSAPNPGPDRVDDLRAVVEDGPADIGVVTDGDADRVGLVAPGVGYLGESLVLAVLYAFLLERDAEAEAGDVVRTVSTSSLVDGVAANAGQRVHETPVGFKWVAEAMAEHDVVLGGEESGGYGVSGHLQNKDGVIAAVLAAAADAEQPLAARVHELRSTHGPVMQDRISVACPDREKVATMETLAANPPTTVAGHAVTRTEQTDGLKLYLKEGWVLVRPSGTEPKLRVYAEASDSPTVERLLSAARERVAAVTP